MGSMDAFLRHMETPEFGALFDGLDERWNARAASLNARMEAEDLPVRFANLGTIWTVLYARPSRYNWMLQYYLRAEGLALSWVAQREADLQPQLWRGRVRRRRRSLRRGSPRHGSGRLVVGGDDGVTNKMLRRRVLRELLSKRRRKG